VNARSRAALVALAIVAGVAPAAAISGRVQDESGRPLVRASACIVIESETVGMCATTDATGYFSLPGDGIAAVRVSAPGFLSIDVAGIDHEEPIRLLRAARFDLAVIDASAGTAVAGARVWLLSPDGRRRGPIDLGPAGKLKMNSFVPGEYRVEVSAPGYERDASTTLVLAPGASTDVQVRLRRSPAADAP